MFKLLSNQAPYEDDRHGTILQKLNAMATRPVPAIQDRRSDVPKTLAALVTRLLARDVDDRPAIPAEVARALAPFTEEADLVSLLVRWAGSPQAAVETHDIAGQGTEEHLSNSLTETWSGQAGRGSG